LEQAPRPSCRRPWGEAWWQLLMLARWRPSLHASDRGALCRAATREAWRDNLLGERLSRRGSSGWTAWRREVSGERKRGLRKISASSLFFVGLSGGFKGLRKLFEASELERRFSGTFFFALNPLYCWLLSRKRIAFV
jgi:hypothetical protein